MDNIQAAYDAIHSLNQQLMREQCTAAALKRDNKDLEERNDSLFRQLDHITKQYEGAMEECRERGVWICDLKDKLAKKEHEERMGHPRTRGEQMVARVLKLPTAAESSNNHLIRSRDGAIIAPHLDLTRDGEGVEIDARGQEFPLGSPRVQKKQRPTDVLAPATPEPAEVTPIRVVHPADVPAVTKKGARRMTISPVTDLSPPETIVMTPDDATKAMVPVPKKQTARMSTGGRKSDVLKRGKSAVPNLKK
jgi:hypothetical protein